MNADDDAKIALSELRNLGFKNPEVSLIQNKYGTNDRVYIANIRDNTTPKKFIVKFFRDKESMREIEGIELLNDFIPTSEIIHLNKTEGLAILKHYDGSLYIDLIYKNEFQEDYKSIIEIENHKEDLLSNLHIATKSKISTQDYINLHNNRLYKERILGKRFEEFFISEENNISKYFSFNLIINGHNYRISINDIISIIRQKFLELNATYVEGFLDHGDAHSWNLLINNSNNDLKFIDFEYYDYIPPYMALTKPLYCDFWGNLFFYFNDTLKEIFSIKKFEIYNNSLNIDLQLNRLPSLRLELAKIKITKRNKFFKGNAIDFMNINDYVLISHLLTRNPNKYSPDVQIIFLALTPLLFSSNLLDPEDLFTLL